jgi:CheY-like chemotaxis protein
LRELAKDPKVIDALVSDLAMPGLTGFDVVKKARTLAPHLPVVLVSGYVRPQDVEQAAQIGVRRVIMKPDTVEQLAEVLYEVLK